MIKSDFMKVYEELDAINEGQDTSKPALELSDAEVAELTDAFGPRFSESDLKKEKWNLMHTDWTFEKLKHCKEVALNLKKKMDDVIFSDKRVQAGIAKGYIAPELVLVGYFKSAYGNFSFEINVLYPYKNDYYNAQASSGTDLLPDGSLGVYGKFSNPEEEYIKDGSNRILWELHRNDPTPEEEDEYNKAINAIYSEPYIDGRYNGD